MSNTLVAVVDLVIMLTQLLIWGLVIWAVMSWLVAFNVVNTHNGFVRAVLTGLDRVYDPMVRPIRRILPDMGGIDLSPAVLWLLLVGVQRLLPAVLIDTGLLS
ncbi:YggT family protein [Sandarakinorhabdus sp.]|uniref:YggT family protein n=1 Tax=Sandarakinorhabdus sp. TaxID=1916663 RepID=UPI00286E0297|nr:YggT family protein [Sandarakinorhabdus sp.]